MEKEKKGVQKKRMMKEGRKKEKEKENREKQKSKGIDNEKTQKINLKSEKIESWVVSAIEQSGSPFYPNIIYSKYIDFDLFDTCFDISGEKITHNKNI